MKRTAAQNPIRERKKCAAFVKALLSSCLPFCGATVWQHQTPQAGRYKKKSEGLVSEDRNGIWEENK